MNSYVYKKSHTTHPIYYFHSNKFSELRSIYKYYIDSYNALYQLKTEKEEDLNSIYKLIKTELIDSKKYPPKRIMDDILNIITYNNRYTNSYLSLAKLISDDYRVTEINKVKIISVSYTHLTLPTTERV